MSRPSRSRVGLGLVLATVLASGACTSLRPALEARVVDAVSGTPVVGASVRLDVAVDCQVNGGLHRDTQPRWYGVTDRDGHFAFLGDPVTAACWWPVLWGSLRVRAPGYLAAEEPDVFRKPGPALREGRLALEVEGRAGATTGRPGHFARIPGAAWQRVAVSREGYVLAAERAGGRLQAWTPGGEPVRLALPGQPELLGIYHRPERDYPLVGLGGRVFALDDPTRWLEVRSMAGALRAAVESHGQLVTLESSGRLVGSYDIRGPALPLRVVGLPNGEARPVREVVEGAGDRADCLTALPGPGRRPFLVAGTEGGRRIVAWLPAPAFRRSPAWSSLPVRYGALGAPITACAGGRGAVYLATVEGEILKLEQPQGPNGPWDVTRRVRIDEGLRGRVAVAMAVAAEPIRPDVLYVVAGDEVVERFDEDLVPE